MTHHEFEEQDRETLLSEISAITEKAVEAGLSYRVRTTKEGEWFKASVTIFGAGEVNA
ncbi:MAG: hypothetical protein RSE12_17175 [Fuscovulum sp.]|nr:MAG: hypothetical protein RSE12_17175 [Fuscovulum sp.]